MVLMDFLFEVEYAAIDPDYGQPLETWKVSHDAIGSRPDGIVEAFLDAGGQ